LSESLHKLNTEEIPEVCEVIEASERTVDVEAALPDELFAPQPNDEGFHEEHSDSPPDEIEVCQ